MTDAFDMGMALIAGASGPSWQKRAQIAREILGPVLGGEPPVLPFMPPGNVDAPLRRMHAAHTQSPRGDAMKLARRVLLAVFERDFDVLREALGETIWVLWPAGPVGHHSSADWISYTESRPYPPHEIEVRDIRSYDAAELQNALPRGAADGIDAVFRLDLGLLVTAEMHKGGTPLGRLMIGMRRKGDDWICASLPMAAPDSAHIASKRTRMDQDPIAAVGEELVRRVILGHGRRVGAHAHYLCDTLWVRNKLATREQLIQLAMSGPHRLNTIDTVLMGTQTKDVAAIRKLLPGRLVEDVLASVDQLFRRPLEKLDARITITQLGNVNPTTGRAKASQKAVCWVVRGEDGLGREGPRVAGLFI